MLTLLRNLQSKRARGDRGFTLIELLVVMIIIGIIAAIAIPVFMNQKAKAYDTSVKSDLKSFATNAETYYADNNAYGTTSAQFANGGAGSPIVSKDNTYQAYMVTGSTPGYVIYGENTQSGKVFYVSSFNGTTVTATGGTWASVTAPAAGTLGIPSGATVNATAITWS